MSGSALNFAIRQLAHGVTLGADEVSAAFDVIMRGEASPAQTSALLVALRVKGETADEVAGVARALRAVMVPVPARAPESLVDTCGTGGGSVRTFNISTAAALLAAGAGVRVAKHGNRSFTSQCGSADVLEALGVRIEVSVEAMSRSLEDAGIVFMFAPLMHPAMKYVGPVRRELGIPTVMNIVGPLANPAMAGRQVVGVAETGRMRLIAGALAELRSRHAMVVHGEPGMDEISPIGTTHVIDVRGGEVREWTIEPARHGFRDIAVAELAGGDPDENAQIVLRVLGGGGSRGARAAVILNAAAAIYVSGMATDFDEGVTRASEALASQAGLAALERLRDSLGRDTPS
ncbi:MAG: anthranilate phosphoribosyltransferase [Gemmatimonadaceae bacterium]